jgi:hypothetical protein
MQKLDLLVLRIKYCQLAVIRKLWQEWRFSLAHIFSVEVPVIEAWGISIEMAGAYIHWNKEHSPKNWTVTLGLSLFIFFLSFTLIPCNTNLSFSLPVPSSHSPHHYYCPQTQAKAIYQNLSYPQRRAIPPSSMYPHSPNQIPNVSL